jgi:hypothetical protein
VVYQPPAVQREVVYPNGKYVLYGDGVNEPYQWVWMAAAPPPPAPPQPDYWPRIIPLRPPATAVLLVLALVP